MNHHSVTITDVETQYQIPGFDHPMRMENKIALMNIQGGGNDYGSWWSIGLGF